MDPLSRLISDRIAVARTEAGLSQEVLADKLGFKDRQTVSAIELGQRRVAPEELVALSEILGRPVDYFTDPYVVAEKNAFSYRANSPSPGDLQAFERQAERLIAAQRRFRQLLGETPSPVQPQLPALTKGMPLDFATFQGEQTAAAWKLGDIPAQRLREAAEHQLRIMVLFVDAPKSVSGAACRLPDGGVILINRNEPTGRQNFDLGHEIFHLLTWERMPPEKVDEIGGARSKVEKLADAYTGGLLMPSSVVQSRWRARGSQSADAWIQANAKELLVSFDALYWRLVNLELIEKDKVPLTAVKAGPSSRGESKPNLYSVDFVRALHRVLDRGQITVLKAAELLDCGIDELESLFKSYKLDVPFAI